MIRTRFFSAWRMGRISLYIYCLGIVLRFQLVRPYGIRRVRPEGRHHS